MKDLLTKDVVWNKLKVVKDPEIPTLSLVDMGIIRELNIEGDSVEVVITPTFVGCPAIEMMKDEIESALLSMGFQNVLVRVSFSYQWNSDMINEAGRKSLVEFGLAPPPQHQLIEDIEILERIPCPACKGTNTELRNSFGPTLCRSIHYCNDCKEAFQQFKPVN
ncbi:MAG: phenylacetate-CoA oxygenase subunit PaaJ [Cyclobacteriaceae bacterium]|nr:phenylacetate-CoA oxygenase subunit PaaJ [Cyclobacteriaceae bacterium]